MAKKDSSSHFSEIYKDIKAGNLKPIYALDGEEPYYIDLLSDLLEASVLQPHEKDFNQTILYGKDTTWTEVLNVCNKYPMFAEKQLVILKEAQTLKDIEKLENYILKPMQSTVLVICYKYKKIDTRKKFGKLLGEKTVAFTSDPIRDYQMDKWVANYLSDKKINYDAKVIETLVTYLGTDLQKVVNEVDKMLINLPQDKTITLELIEKYVGISREYNVFELPQAILKGNTEQAFRIVNYFEANPKDAPMVVVLTALYSSFQKLYAYHYLANHPDATIAAQLKIAPFLVKDYRSYGKLFSLYRTEKVLEVLYKYSQASLGVTPVATNLEGTLIKELCAQIVYHC